MNKPVARPKLQSQELSQVKVLTKPVEVKPVARGNVTPSAEPLLAELGDAMRDHAKTRILDYLQANRSYLFEGDFVSDQVDLGTRGYLVKTRLYGVDIAVEPELNLRGGEKVLRATNGGGVVLLEWIYEHLAAAIRERVNATKKPKEWPQPFKVAVIADILQNWSWVPSQLPANDLPLATKQVSERLYNYNYDGGQWSIEYTEKLGLRATMKDGEPRGEWPYIEITRVLLNANELTPEQLKRGPWVVADLALRAKTVAPVNSKAPAKAKAAKATKAPPVSQDTKAIPGPATTVERNAEIDVKAIDRHPINRHPTAADVDERAASMATDGQLDACEVRRMPGGRYQMISGETRWLAAKKNKWPKIRANVIECDDVEARRRVALHNAQRKDLDPIERAKLIVELCKPIEEGGNSYTRERAAAEVGLQSASAASHLVRLLQLPKEWQKRVADGELPESFARLLVPYVPAPKLMEQLEKWWKKGKSDWRDGNWESKLGVEELLRELRFKCTRPMDGKETTHYDFQQVGQYRNEPRLFDRSAEIDKQLGVIEIEVGGTVQLLATDAKAFDRLNIPLVKAKVAKEVKSRASRAGRDKPKSKKPPTAAELKKRTEEQAEQLKNRIRAWRHNWLKQLIAARLDKFPLIAQRVIFWLVTSPLQHFVLHELDPEGIIVRATKQPDDVEAWDALGKACGEPFCTKHVDFAAVGLEIARGVILAPDKNPKFPVVDFEKIDDLAAMAKIDLAAEWAAIQKSDADESARATFASFFELHQTTQLDALCRELGFLQGSLLGKAGRVKLITGVVRNFKLPKSVKPVEQLGTTKKVKRGAK